MIHEIDQFPGREIVSGGRRFLYFGGTSYLGLQHHGGFLEVYTESIRRYGTVYAASRKANVQFPALRESEAFLAGITGSEAGISTSSGFLACRLLLQVLEEENIAVYRAPGTHIAWNGTQEFTANDLEELYNRVSRSLESGIRTAVVFDTIDFAGKKPMDFSWLTRFPVEKLLLIADDSHGLGITGPDGGGNFKKLLSLSPSELICCSSLGKAFGIQAGFIAGKHERIEKIMAHGWTGGASPANPGNLRTVQKAYPLIREQRSKLFRNVSLFLNELNTPSRFLYVDDYPCFTTQDEELPRYLEDNGVIITNFRYPDPDSPLMCRIVLSAAHTVADIKNLTKLLNAYIKQKNNP
ncbi:aminotransferase class I/II-fold pyridoxal phosphate-dependent enzyme [Robertkochia aurantiaca]|uniref:aminotransferase class I/II-fold pyridoxal phosphate-dependent enzyme n=1 Tax=Robertkochia aurantiaca TaxID=2873700 RepID=UPI001CCDFFB2|nr:aminotransferase class I/II-fold pyridoxal phosphate-dependent enzyme [Robertkochia sp. 3YJGBD-33]